HTRLQGDWSSDVCSSDLVQPCSQNRVDLFPLRQQLVEWNVTNNCSQRGGGESYRGAGEVLHLNNACRSVYDFVVDEEVDVYWCVVFGNCSLVRHLKISFSQ